MASPRATLQAKPREGAGKGPARRLRAEGLIPAVVYGRHSKTAQQIAVDPLEIKKAVSAPARLNTLIQLKLDGQGERLVLLKEFQLDPVSRQMLHADFLEVREGERVKVNVPIVLVGKPAGVLAGGILSQARRQIEVLALPTAIPDKIEVDVSHLKMAQALHINDVKLPEGLAVRTTVNFTVAVVSVPEKEEVVAPPPTEEAAAAAEGAPAAEGKPAAPGAAPPPADAKAAAPAPPAGKAAAPAAAAKGAAPGKKEEGKAAEKKK
jgi:large subunit ribosomal protein L25